MAHSAVQAALPRQLSIPLHNAPQGPTHHSLRQRIPQPSPCHSQPASRRLALSTSTARAASSDAGSDSSSGSAPPAPRSLKKGDAVVISEEPPFVKTAEPMPMLRRNNGAIQKGDVGRILDSRPKDTWAVRLSTGAFLIDGKYLQPLQ